MPRRAGPGLPKGYKFKKTLEKERAREIVRQTITSRLGPMLEAQIANATGIAHLMLRDPSTGQFERVKADTNDPKENAKRIDDALATGNAVWIYLKDPSVQAFTDLLNRALDKPTEQVQVTGGGGPLIIGGSGMKN